MRWVMLAAMAMTMWAGATVALAEEPAPLPVPAALPSATRPLALAGVVYKIAQGEIVARAGNLIFCDVHPDTLPFDAAKHRNDTRVMSGAFDEALRQAGFRNAVSSNLFEPERLPGGLEVGAVIESLDMHLCGGPQAAALRARASMKVEWQIYDPLQRQLLARLETTAEVVDNRNSPNALENLAIGAFRENAKALLAKPELDAIVRRPVETVGKAASGADRTTLLLALAKDTKTPIPEAVGSVVTIFTEGGHGTGFLVSADGYLLTARHVVGESKVVRIRWSDGFESSGEVLRSDKRRDVALLKSTSHGRAPLFLRVSRLNPGDTVYAIGAPLDPKLQGTVSRGIVSAYRLEDGMSFLQSDVMVNHGNSGGPLLDERGAVVGFTDKGKTPDGPETPIGINFFVPIGDALDFLAIKTAP